MSSPTGQRATHLVHAPLRPGGVSVAAQIDTADMRPSEIREMILALAEAQARITRHEHEAAGLRAEINHWRVQAGYLPKEEKR